jgi:hypothetical protein
MLSKRASAAALNTGLGSYYGIHKYSAESLNVSLVGMYTYHWDFTLILAHICYIVYSSTPTIFILCLYSLI